MQAEVDMSGRIEETTRPTVLALANGVSTTLLMSAKEKRVAIDLLLKRKPETDRTLIHVFIFSNLIFLLVQEHIEALSLVTIDPEYIGYEPVIKNRIMTLCKKAGIWIYRDQIEFASVGKKSPAHHLAYKVYKRRVKPNRIVTAKEVTEL
jgi:hypothetical protein